MKEDRFAKIKSMKLGRSPMNMTIVSFSDLLPEIKKRPTLYLSRYSIFDFQSFYYGYDLAKNQIGLPKTEQEREFEEFLLWVRSRYSIQTTQSWASLILWMKEMLWIGCLTCGNNSKIKTNLKLQ